MSISHKAYYKRNRAFDTRIREGQQVVDFVLEKRRRQLSLGTLKLHDLKGRRDPEIHPARKDNPYFSGMKAHISADAESGLVRRVHETAANLTDVTPVAEPLHSQDNAVYADARHSGV